MAKTDKMPTQFSEGFFAALLAAAMGQKEKCYQILRKMANDLLKSYSKEDEE